MALSPGNQLGPYEILAPIGAGGMGEVYKARDTRLDRTVAVKVLPDEIAKREDLLARFEREARAVASLNHPNICSLFDIGPGYMVMELVDGETLADRIGKGALPLDQALKYAVQIADALDRAHRAGVTHRDVKPQNIMVTRDGVKILDFGLAKSATAKPGPQEETLTKVLTTEGTVMGTPQYMAPELFEGKEADARADIWAFGAVLYEMVTGRKTFEGKSYSSLVGAILATDPAPMAVQPFTPSWLERLVRRCLAKDPEARYFSMHDIVLDLRTPPPEPAAEPPGSKRTTPSRPTLWMTIAAAAVLIAIAATTMLWLRSSPPVALASHFNVPAAPGTAIRVSPDGKWLLLRRPDGFYLRPLDGPNWRKVAGTEAARESTVFWSPDSAAFGFVSAGRLRLASLDGSPPRDLMEVQGFQGASWRGTRDDGAILLAINAKLKALDLRTGKVRDLPLAFKADSPPSDPEFLPEGDGLVFLQDRGDGRRLYRSALNSSAAEPLFLTPTRVQFAKHPATGNWHVFYLAGEPELQSSRILRTAPIDPKTGNLLSAPLMLLQGVSTAPSTPPFARFSVGRRGVLSWSYAGNSLPIWRLAWTDRTGKLLTRVSETRGYVSLALSPDESRIAVQVDDPDGHIWILDSKTGLGGRLSTSPEPETYPHWAPDGKSLFYVSGTAAAFEIRRSFLDNALKPEVLWRSESLNESPRLTGISPDGCCLLVIRRNGSLYRLDLKSTPPEKMELLEERRSGYASLSPDGRSLVWMTVTEGLILRAWPLTAEPVKRFARGGEVVDKPFFSADGRALYGLFQGNLVMFPLSPDRSIGEPGFLRPWHTTSRAGAHGGVASRDGKRLLLIETDEEEILNPQVLTDWTTLLPK